MIIWCLDLQNIKRVSLVDSRIFILSPFQLQARLKTPTQAPTVANTCINSYLMAATIYSHLNHKYFWRNWVHFNQELIDFLPLSSLLREKQQSGAIDCCCANLYPNADSLWSAVWNSAPLLCLIKVSELLLFLIIDWCLRSILQLQDCFHVQEALGSFTCMYSLITVFLELQHWNLEEISWSPRDQSVQ